MRTTPLPLDRPILLSLDGPDGPELVALVGNHLALELVGGRAWWAWCGTRFKRVVVGMT